MKRRALLASAGSSLTALSGCLLFTGEDRDPPPTEESPVDETSTQTPEAPAGDVTVESVTQQYGYAGTNDDAVPVNDVDTQYVVADVSVAGGRLARDDFAWTFESSGRGPTTPPTFYRTEWGDDQWYEEGRERGLLLFEMPENVAPAMTRLVWPGGEWVADDAFLDRLTSPKPSMSTSIAVPDAADGTTDKTVAVEVTNEGAVDGRYVGAVNRSGPMIAYTPVEYLNRLVGAGETVTVDIADSWSEYPATEDGGDGVTTVTYHLEDASGGDTLEIDLSE